MKRKYPASFFFFGVLINLFKYGIILVLSLVLTVVGLLCDMDICVKIGWAVLAVYFAVCVIVQIQIRHATLTKSDNEEYNQMMDQVFGVEDDKDEKDNDDKDDTDKK